MEMGCPDSGPYGNGVGTLQQRRAHGHTGGRADGQDGQDGQTVEACGDQYARLPDCPHARKESATLSDGA